MIPNIRSLVRYLSLFFVLKYPSTIKNIKIGKAILPRIEKIFDITKSVPLPLVKVLSVHY